MSRGTAGGSELGFGDLARTMGAIEEHHHVMVSLTAERMPSGNGGLRWNARATVSARLGDRSDPFNPKTWVVTWDEFTPDLGRTAPNLYRLLLKLDSELTVVRWAQSPLPEG